ncbi:alpha/beta hydrolase [Solibacillus silvestris]|uniref:alpha/beta hydrolase n=1 Tax=Solibacillus silvestris TaxID=76853 RepID=UPI003F8032A7
MDQHSFYATMSDGHDIFVRTFTPKGNKLGHIHILHGMAEHSARYERFAEKLCEEGYFVSAHDHRGHGFTAQKSGMLGCFGLKNGFDRIVEDVHEVLAYLKDETAGRPILFGHSMGSFIARRFIQQYSGKIERLILSGTGSPTLLHETGHIVARQLVKLQGAKTRSKLMDKLSFGNFNRNIPNAKTNFDWLSTDEKEVQKYIDDPFCGFVATNQFFADLTGGMAMLKNDRENARIRPDLKILLISGTEDPVGGTEAKGVLQAGKQLALAGVKQVKVHLFEGMRHEILNEKKKQQVIEIIVRWLKNE